MRITKKHDERRREFMEVSSKLFAEQGFDEISVNDIIKATNVAKGTFYHYFSSKQVLIEEIINEQINNFSNSISNIIKDKKLSFHRRFKSIILEVLNSETNFLLIDSINNPNSHSVHDDFLLKGVDNCVEMLAEFISEGVKAGVVKVRHPKELIYISVLGVNSITRVIRNKEGKTQKEIINSDTIKLLLQVTEEVFNMQPDSLVNA